MPSSTLDGPRRVVPLIGAAAPVPAGDWSHNSAHLLQRTQTLVGEEPADPRFWTAYDYFTLERQARALRRAYLGSLFVAAWTRLRVHFAPR